MTWIRKNYKLTLALLALLTAFFTWSVNDGGFLVSSSAAQIKKLEAKIVDTDKRLTLNTDKLQNLQVKQAKDTAEIKSGLESVKKELEEQREDTRQVRNDIQEVLRLLVKMSE